MKDTDARASQPAWISVDDRLPEPDTDVLIWSRRRGSHEVAGYRPWDRDDNHWAIDGTFYPRDEATHWMPLPTTPEQRAEPAELPIASGDSALRDRLIAAVRSKYTPNPQGSADDNYDDGLRDAIVAIDEALAASTPIASTAEPVSLSEVQIDGLFEDWAMEADDGEYYVQVNETGFTKLVAAIRATPTTSTTPSKEPT